jgi:protein-S-isoprenylcysteine O-methyltransferase Ste14
MTGNEMRAPHEQNNLRKSGFARLFEAIRSGLFTPEPSRVMLLDVVERAVVTLIFARFAVVMLTAPAGTAGILNLFLLVSESLAFFLILTRRQPTARSDTTVDWLLGVSGAVLPLLVLPTAVDALIPEQLSGAIMLMGLYVQISAKVILGRSFGLIAANRGVKVQGPYRIVRHPMYAGYTIIHIGFLLAFPSLWNLVLYATAFAIQIARVFREERLLSQDQSYRDYSARVRYRFIPKIF